MKRMNEVFELPLSGEENQGEPFLSDQTYYFASFDDEMTFEDGKGLERAKHAAHAINNVDKLADALEVLIFAVESGELLNSDFNGAKSALAAYRGEK